MKPFGKTKDGVIDNLLRAYVSRPSNLYQACPEFDPDLANAYIERSLTPGSRSHYEEHLSECAACRKNVVALARLYDAAALASLSTARKKNRAGWLSGAKQVFGALSRPQWAMAAAAAIVLAISLPVLLSRNETRQASLAVAEQSASDKPQSAIAAASPGANLKSGDIAPSASAAATSKQRKKRETDALGINAPAASNTSEAAAGIGAGADQSKRLEARSAPRALDEVQRKSQGQVASPAPAQAGATPGSQVAKNESDQGRQQQQEKDSAQQAADAKQDRTDEPRDKEKTAKSEEAVPPAAASTSDVARARGGLRRAPAKLALRDSAGESVRPVERKILSKKFSFRNDTWTDKDFDPNKDLPVVTIIRDSNVYQEELAKRAGLKPYLTGFTGTERAIIVYKGTVYKLIPQQSDK